jgi:hypothetical protein
MRDLSRWIRLLATLWLGLLLTVAAVATPSAFATLPTPQAGLVVARVLASEAAASLVLGAALLALMRLHVRQVDGSPASQFSLDFGLALCGVFMTVIGYYAVLPLMDQARAGLGRFSFAQLHVASSACFLLKACCIAALAWRTSAVAATAETALSPQPSSSGSPHASDDA